MEWARLWKRLKRVKLTEGEVHDQGNVKCAQKRKGGEDLGGDAKLLTSVLSKTADSLMQATS